MFAAYSLYYGDRAFVALDAESLPSDLRPHVFDGESDAEGQAAGHHDVTAAPTAPGQRTPTANDYEMP